MTTIFEKVDEISKIGLTIPTQMHTKNLRIVRSLKRTLVKNGKIRVDFL